MSNGTAVPIADLPSTAPNGQLVLAGGETQESETELSEVKPEEEEAARREASAIVEHYQIDSTLRDESISQEDDEMLQMQMQLGEVQENNLKRRIEHKRRRELRSESLSGNSFNLSRELSMEMDRDRAAKYMEAKERNKVLENEISLYQSRAEADKVESYRKARIEIEAEAEEFKAQLLNRFYTEVETKVDAAKKEAEIEESKRIRILRSEATKDAIRVFDEYRGEMHGLKEEHARALKTKTSEYEQMKNSLKGAERHREEIHCTQVAELRQCLAEACMNIEQKDYQMAQIVHGNSLMENHIALLLAKGTLLCRAKQSHPKSILKLNYSGNNSKC